LYALPPHASTRFTRYRSMSRSSIKKLLTWVVVMLT
jgi:hypothetical protein